MYVLCIYYLCLSYVLSYHVIFIFLPKIKKTQLNTLTSKQFLTVSYPRVCGQSTFLQHWISSWRTGATRALPPWGSTLPSLNGRLFTFRGGRCYCRPQTKAMVVHLSMLELSFRFSTRFYSQKLLIWKPNISIVNINILLLYT